MGTLTAAAKNEMLDALTADRVQLHSGAPGAAGTDNVIAGTYVPVTYDVAAGGERDLDAPEAFTGLDSLQTVTHVTVWDHNGGAPVLLATDDLAGDLAANAAGEYNLASAPLSVGDPA